MSRRRKLSGGAIVKTYPSPEAQEAMERAVQVDWTMPVGESGFELSHLMIPHHEAKGSAVYEGALLLDYGVQDGRSHGCCLFRLVPGTDEGWRSVFQDDK